MAKKKDTSDAPFQIPIFTSENKTRLENFYETYKQQATYVLSGILIILIGFYAYRNFVVKPKETEARDLIFMAEYYFGIDSFELALNGPPDQSFFGFLDIIDDYKSTKTGNLARYYAGICYMHLQDYDEAIRQLKKYRTKSRMLRPITYGAIGDAYSELEDYKQAVKYYVKAYKNNKNEFTTPLYMSKAALVYEELEQYNKAIEIYEAIKKDFKDTQEAANVDKYLGRVKMKAGK